mmetsp:Transcript_1078/g.1206  ORF Transcript_1078/g.1206 Transcript_1078/m.1206 type:complete len:302 (+) Transcript_1078:91-996(+)|eukprot:CAMPEP_0119041604 /NCGR_PEP_ID=MMETSP1177-20130426/12594_1 /TAXON_ID=2985 /ORGANISM="Ochromonas sp, Strain CCMP1899" /LENGTH=301 /DNA_ID=CAMNT_0007007781 /DNA_START=56 /DNA_END=961 /DNA_ORIENTATION=-
MALSSGSKLILAAFAVSAPLSQGFLSQRPLIHNNIMNKNSIGLASDTSRNLIAGNEVLITDGLHSIMEHFSSLTVAAEGAERIAAETDFSKQAANSNLGYYGTLGLYVLTLPGLYSLVTRSVKIKAIQRTYDLPGPLNPTSKPLRQTAGEVMAYFKALNYDVTTAEDVITFKGLTGRSKSQAAFLTFCTFMGLASLGLVLSILLPDVGAKAYLLALLSPYAGIYYWKNAQGENTVKVKMETSDDEQTTSIMCEGGKEDLERFSKTMDYVERGKVFIKGLIDGEETSPEGAAAVAAFREDLV